MAKLTGCAIVAGLALALSAWVGLCAEPETAPADLVNGVWAKLEADRMEAYPGERIRLRAEVRVESRSPLILPVLPYAGGGVLHIKTPDGGHLILDYTRTQSLGTVVNGPHGSMAAVDTTLDLVDAPPDWKTPESDPARTLSMRKPGRYELWYELEAKTGWRRRGKGLPEPNADDWVGRVVSKTLTVTVAPLTPEVVRDKPSKEELDDLRIVRQGRPQHSEGEVNVAQGRLGTALMLAPNDGLAKEIVGLLVQDKAMAKSREVYWWHNLHYLVLQRAWRENYKGHRIGIEGSYLRPFVELQLELLEEWYKREPPTKTSGVSAMPRGTSLLVAYVAQNKVHSMRERLLALARRNVRMPELAKDSSPGASQDLLHYYSYRLNTCWHILTDLGVLPGMSTQEATELLGKPKQEKGQTSEWYVETGDRRGPTRLVLEFADGKVTKATLVN